MTYHIPRGSIVLWNLRAALDLVEQRGWRELQQPSEKVEPTTVRHTNDDMLNARYD